MTLYECQFAPHAATRREVIRNAQLMRHHGTAAYEVFGPDAFKGWGKEEIRVLLNHDPEQHAGTVCAIAPHKDWWTGTFVLDGPCAARGADWIERCGKLSPGFLPGEVDPDFARPITLAHDPTHWHIRGATLDEISILSPGSHGWFEGARVTGTLKPSAATVAHRAAADDGEVFYGGGKIVRYFDNAIIGIR